MYFTKFGARKLAHYVEREIDSIRQSCHPGGAAGDGAAGRDESERITIRTRRRRQAERSAAASRGRPVLPLNGIPASSEELLGGSSAPARPASTDPTATRVLTKGEQVAPRPAAPTISVGRAGMSRTSRRPSRRLPSTALSKPPTRMPGTGEPEPEPGSDAQKAADAKKAAEAAQKARQATQSAPQRSFFSPQQWFRGFGRW